MYTKEERLSIGHRIYDGEISRYQAAETYGISSDSAREYMRLYRDVNNLPPKSQKGNTYRIQNSPESRNLADYEAMTKEELIQELIKARITEARLKKGYEVKGDGPDKEFVPLDNKNIK